MVGKIGVLALQGAFSKHFDAIQRLNVPAIFVRYPEELRECDGLILPGGESTTMTKHIHEMDLLQPLLDFAVNKPLFGTCAGMILMSNLLGLIDIQVARNGYGRQCASCCVKLDLSFSSNPVEVYFIRAPRITKILSPDVKILASYKDEPVCVQQGHHLAASFHPELTNDTTMHQYFVQLCKAKQSVQQPSTTTRTKSSRMT